MMLTITPNYIIGKRHMEIVEFHYDRNPIYIHATTTPTPTTPTAIPTLFRKQRVPQQRATRSLASTLVAAKLAQRRRPYLTEVQFKIHQPKPPESVCSLSCEKGQAKKYVEGESCCWHCFNCSLYQVNRKWQFYHFHHIELRDVLFFHGFHFFGAFVFCGFKSKDHRSARFPKLPFWNRCQVQPTKGKAHKGKHFDAVLDKL